jgi:hypothetical protein
MIIIIYEIIINNNEDAYKNVFSVLKHLHDSSTNLKFPIMFRLVN